MPDETEPMLQFFEYAHLRDDLSKTFHDIANWIVGTLPRNPERTVACASCSNRRTRPSAPGSTSDRGDCENTR